MISLMRQKSIKNKKGSMKIALVTTIITVFLIGIITYYFYQKSLVNPNSNISNSTTPDTQLTQSQAFLVRGYAMMPNYNPDTIWLYKPYVNSTPQKNDIILYTNPKAPGILIPKRIVGLPNESVKIMGGKVYINNKILNEDYLAKDTNTIGGVFLKEGEEVTVPANHYFVLGDNRKNSSDSRIEGFLPEDMIIGKITNEVQKLDVPKENCKCWDTMNLICLEESACY